ncbi:hypothetical protein [uncultured Psychrobacter sp.]|uniref:hypothetical protein n=1 Tax=uncultured Psychrobacter sp. TaxID=259303 RepID=UPI00345AFE29
MPMLKPLTRRLILPSLVLLVLGTLPSVSVIASNHSEQNIYQQESFGEMTNQLRQDLRRDGYYVMDVQADGNNQIDVYAKKDHQPYVLTYSYPELELISTDKKQWSNVWKNRKHKNIEDSIKQEARYPTVKKRAIGKINDMDYQVEKIELEEEDNHGVFEIEAKRGSQDFEVVLGYPDLDIIKIEKD